MITMKTLNQATAQEVFDKVVGHIRNQEYHQAADVRSGNCYYRKDDLKCAAGCLISDEEYHQDMEMQSWDEISPGTKHDDLILELQELHDGMKNLSLEDNEKEFERGAVKLANAHNLNYNRG